MSPSYYWSSDFQYNGSKKWNFGEVVRFRQSPEDGASMKEL